MHTITNLQLVSTKLSEHMILLQAKSPAIAEITGFVVGFQ